jgi:hypothetical protein
MTDRITANLPAINLDETEIFYKHSGLKPSSKMQVG